VIINQKIAIPSDLGCLCGRYRRALINV